MDACLATALAGTQKVKILFLRWPNIFFLGANVYNNKNHNTGRVNLKGERGSFNLFLSNCDYILMWVLQIGQHLHIINIGISSTPSPPLSLSLDCRLRIFYLFSLCYFQTVNSKKVRIKNMESKVYESFSNFFNFPDTALKLGAYYFQSNLTNVAITQF